MVRDKGEINFKKSDFHSMLQQTYRVTEKVLVREARKLMETRSHGRVYTYKGRPYTASRYGDSPNIRSGELIKTIRGDVQGTSFIFGVGDGEIDYAEYLEDKKNLNRPLLTKALENKRNKVATLFSYFFKKQMGLRDGINVEDL